MDLFDIKQNQCQYNAPLAYRMRPENIDDIIGQPNILGPGSPFRRALEKDELNSCILFGPPGTGKTSIANIIADMTNSHFEPMQAVVSGVSDIRKIASDAENRLKYYQQKTILFVDEIHRFNKSQQDVLLPFLEKGILLLIGATTENPLYELNNALLSRVRIYLLEALDGKDISLIINRALKDKKRGLGKFDIKIDQESVNLISQAAKGDARTALNILDTIVNSYMDDNLSLIITADLLKNIIKIPLIRYDRTGDGHYDTVSAFIKSIRGSDPDAALFWLAVMLEGGEDPEFIARRLIIQAAEDIGLADPFALPLAISAADAVRFIGLPEARIPLAEAVIYLATAPKSNSIKNAIDKATNTARTTSKIKVPLHITNNSHPKSYLLDKGKGYRYPHNYGGYIKQNYLPDNLEETTFYYPGENGHEKKINEFLKNLK